MILSSMQVSMCTVLTYFCFVLISGLYQKSQFVPRAYSFLAVCSGITTVGSQGTICGARTKPGVADCKITLLSFLSHAF